MPYTVNTAHRPLIVLEVDTGDSDEELQGYIRELCRVADEAIAHGWRYVAIVPHRRHTSPMERGRIAAAHKVLTPQQTAVIAVSYVVAPDAVVRGAFTALRWLVPKKLGPVKMVGTLEEAYAQALEEVRALGLPEPHDLPGLRRTLGLLAKAESA